MKTRMLGAFGIKGFQRPIFLLRKERKILINRKEELFKRVKKIKFKERKKRVVKGLRPTGDTDIYFRKRKNNMFKREGINIFKRF